MSELKKLCAIVMVIIMAFSVTTENVFAAKKVKLNKVKATIYVGKTVQLKVNNNKKKVKWSSSNKKVATVSKRGKVTGKKAGKATITAQIGKKKYKCKIIVKKKAVVNQTKVPETKKNLEGTTTNDYGDNGEDWIVKSTSDKCWIQEYVGTDKNIVIPAKICGKTVIGIENGVFKNNKMIVSVEISYGVVTIGDGVFESCSNLERILIPDSVTSIGDYAFWGCSSLTKIVIPNSVTSIGDRLFTVCSSLESVKLSDNVTSIGNNTFFECGSLTNITIPDSVTSIGDYAFSFCYNLTSITIPDNVVWIGEYTFVPCNNLKTIKGKKGSYAEQWANENNYEFVEQYTEK